MVVAVALIVFAVGRKQTWDNTHPMIEKRPPCSLDEIFPNVVFLSVKVGGNGNENKRKSEKLC